ncbi:MAG: UvrD-helicase domain-containing protein [Muribaculaceae bacterium]
MEEYIAKLNDQQREAVLYNEGPSLVIAGAGSGKTRVLTYKIIHLLNLGYDPHRILALTFTNKAAREMKERISQLVGDTTASHLWMGTFHSIFSRILRYNADKIGFKKDFTIYDSADSKSLIKMIVKDMQLDDKIYKPSSLQSHISNLKNSLISPVNYESDANLRANDNYANRPKTYAIYNAYWNRCRIAGAMDFDDLLFYTNILLRDNPDVLKKYQEFFKYILVDEYQDTNFAQHLIVSQLSQGNNHICVVGDDAQSIYSFRGANISNILNLKKSYPKLKTFKLEQNYRSTQTIINAANSLIAKNTQQIPKNIFSNNDIGDKIPVMQSYSEYEESYVVANKIVELKISQSDLYDEFAILYRTNAQSRVLEEALRKRNIPYRIYGGLSFYQRKEIKDAISYFRLTVNCDDDEALRRIINYPARGIGDTTVGKIQQSAILNNTSMWNVICEPKLYNLNINNGTLRKLEEFTTMIKSFIALNEDKADAFELARNLFSSSKILSILYTENTPENISKQENLQELLNGIQEFVISNIEEGLEDNIYLSNFLSEVSLATDQDNENEADEGTHVTLMTVHAAKGLEFKNVIIVGVEEDLFPSGMNNDTISGIEEERRLMYVAITRAKINCILTFATSRFFNGQTKSCSMSRFIREIDPIYLRLTQTSSSDYGSNKERHINQVATYNKIAAKNDYNTNSNNPTIDLNGEFTLHDKSEVSVGMKVSHSRFGLGIIKSIESQNLDAKITVDFENIGVKKLLLKFAKFEIINS